MDHNRIDPFLKWMVTRIVKWITYDNIKRKQLQSNRVKLAQSMVKLRLMVRMVGYVFGKIRMESTTMICSPTAKL